LWEGVARLLYNRFTLSARLVVSNPRSYRALAAVSDAARYGTNLLFYRWTFVEGFPTDRSCPRFLQFLFGLVQIEVVLQLHPHRDRVAVFGRQREARNLERERIKLLEKRTPDPHKRGKSYGSMTIEAAMAAYIAERRGQVATRTIAFWQEHERSLTAHFKKLPLKRITAAHIADFQRSRLDADKEPQTINGAVAVLRLLLKHARLWNRISEDYKPVRDTKPPVGRALTPEEQKKLFQTAALWKSNAPLVRQGRDGKRYEITPNWQYAHAAATLAAYCGLRACEIKGLQWKDVDFAAGLLDIRHSKTPGGWRTPTLNAICSDALAGLYATAQAIGATDPEHYVFPWQGGKSPHPQKLAAKDKREQLGEIDPTPPMAGWRTAWRSILKEAGIQARFHDLRHTAVTTMAEAGLPDHVVMAQVGHIDPSMIKHYSHIRRQALNQAAAALQPNFQTAVAELVN
jgi:integrase